MTDRATRDYSQTSYWLADSGDDLTPRPPVTKSRTVDVAILGGGFSGLWTAYFLLRHHPGLEVAVIERDICGFGASGRNGGWCSPRFPVETHALEKRFGADVARSTLLALENMVEEIGRICAEEAIDAHYRETGLLSLARSPAQFQGLQASLRTFERLGLGGRHRLLNAEQAFELVHATQITGALQSETGAAVHPGRLVRGLARAVERRGGLIFEQSEAIHMEQGPNAAILTSGGRISARRAIVAAGEAYLSGIAGFHRSLLPMSSMIVLTAPLSEAQWQAVGWNGGECLSSQVHTKNYLTRTRDGRILFGSRGAPYRYASNISDEALHDEKTFAWMRDCLRDWWPALEDIEFTHAWGGYLGVPRDWMPTVSFDADTRLAQLHGYTGRGVSTSALSAQLLAGLIGGHRTKLEGLPLHRCETPRWEPEPLRWAGVRYVQSAFARIDEAEQNGRGRPWDAALAEFLGEQ